jgi:hypothetical protein
MAALKAATSARIARFLYGLPYYRESGRTDVVRRHLILILVGALVSTAAADRVGVPTEYAANWTCQTFMPGYNIRLPSSDPSQPLTGNATTPSTVAILKFSLKADGTYETAEGKGQFAFDARTKTLTWLDGPHEKTLTKTELGRRDNGAPKIGFVRNERYYGCFVSTSKPRRRSAVPVLQTSKRSRRHISIRSNPSARAITNHRS